MPDSASRFERLVFDASGVRQMRTAASSEGRHFDGDENEENHNDDNPDKSGARENVQADDHRGCADDSYTHVEIVYFSIINGLG